LSVLVFQKVNNTNFLQSKPSWVIEEDSDAENGSEDRSEEGSEDGSDDEQNVKVKVEPKTGSQADDDEKNPLDDVNDDNALEGSVTEDDPPENLFDDDEAEMDESKRKDHAVDPTEEPQHDAEENTREPQEEEHPDEVSDPVSIVHEMDHVEHSDTEETNPLAGDHDLNEDPFGSTVAANDSETPRDNESHPEAGTSVEDLLGETTSAMEAGDKEYKDLIAETQLDNIFN
jgi:hypothetical protein